MIHLCSTPKLQDNFQPRAVAPSDTYRRLPPLMSIVGVRHVIELTLLDKLGVPVCFAFGSLPAGTDLRDYAKKTLPGDENTIDQLLATMEEFPLNPSFPGSVSIFAAGKGLTALDSRVSAMMEAIERFSARQPNMEPYVSSYREMVSRENRNVIDPRTLIRLSPNTFDEDQTLEWVIGVDLFSGEEVWLPAEVGTYTYRPRCSAGVFSDTPTGLGAGNFIEEAVCHGLAEAIEHDAWALAIARITFASAQTGILKSLFGVTTLDSITAWNSTNEAENSFVEVDLDSLEHVWPAADMISQFHRAGAQVKVYDIASDIEIPVFATSITGLPGGPDGGGLGSHPDARLALARALTEAAQQRLLLGLRNPLFNKQSVPNWEQATWKSFSAYSEKETVRCFEEIHSVAHKDILDDIHYMLNALKMRGLNQAILVDLTRPELGMPVVKVIVPGLVDYWTSNTSPQWAALGNRVMRLIAQ
jgi:ribosomal protein S12 methylthiotransferase accessory factor